MLAASVLAVGCAKPTSIAFSPAAPIVIDNELAAPLPAVVGLKEDGTPVDSPPAATFSVEPEGIVTIEAGKLAPLKNGRAKLVATAEGLPPASVDVLVQVIDDVKITCPDKCTAHVGETVPLTAAASGLGVAVTDGLTWQSSDPAKATVDATGKLTAVAAGEVLVTARIGKKSAEQKVLIRPAVDELRLICPWPPLFVRHKLGSAPDSLDRSCDVMEGDSVTLRAMVMSAGAPVEGETIEWKSSDPSVRVINGVVTGDRVGGSVIEVRAAGLVVELPVSVQKPKKKSECASPESFATQTPVTMKLTTPSDATWESNTALRCQDENAQQCIQRAVAEITASARVIPLDAAGLESFGTISLEASARRCCCRQ